MDKSTITEDRTPAWPSAVRAWFAVTVFCIAAILSYTDRQILSLFVDPLRVDLGITDTQIGLLQGVAFAFAYAFMGLPIGRVADVVVRRWLLITGVTAWSVGTLLCGLAHSFATIFAGRIIVGLGEATLAPAVLSMIGDLFPPNRRGIATGTFLMAMLAGGGIAILVGGAVPAAIERGSLSFLPWIANVAPWRATMVLLSISGIVVVALMATVREPVRQMGAVITGVSGVGFSRELYLLRFTLAPLVLGCGIMAVGDFAIVSWLPSLLTRNYGLATVDVSTKLGGIVIATGVLAALSGGYLSDIALQRLGPPGRSNLAIGSAVCALPGALFSLTRTADQVFIFAGVWLFFSTLAGTAAILAVQDCVSNQLRGLSFSMISFTTITIGLGAGAGLPGMLVDKVVGDSHGVARALTWCIVPAALLAILCFGLSTLNPYCRR